MAKHYIIIGGGAAGIAAAYTILGTSKTATVQLFEASGRYGGRAHTDTKAIKGLPFDKGCVYIQDPQNPLNPWPRIASQLGFDTVEDNTDYQLRIDLGNGYTNTGVSAVPAINTVVEGIADAYNQNKAYPNKTVTDSPPPSNQYQGYGFATSPYGPFTESAEPWQYLAADRSREATGDWGANLFVKRGLGTLVRTYGEQLKATFKNRFQETFKGIKAVRYDNGVLATDTSNKTYQGDACVVTVPVAVLAQDTIAFTPALPDAYATALQALRLGSYKKLAVQLNKLPTDIKDNTNYYLYQAAPEGVWQYYRLDYFPKNVLVIHTAGTFAHTLDGMGDDQVFRLFQAAFAQAYTGSYTFVDKYGITQWDKNNYALGAYSYTAPLGFDENNPEALAARKQMAKPVVGKVFFAGEAYNLKAYGTLHGAYIDGVDAAENALRALEK